jgi:hypothetical protein
MMWFSGLDDTRQDWFHRFVLYDLLGRVGAGVHGDRGGVEYYIRTGSFGLLPWGAVVPFALSAAVVRSRSSTTVADALTTIVSLWFVIVLSFFAMTSTKFHHYLLPATIPAALVCAQFGRSLLRRSNDSTWWLLACGAVPLAIVGARELILAPWEVVDLFTYHYQGYQPSYYFPVDKIDRIELPGGFTASFYRVVLIVGAVLVPLTSMVMAGWAWHHNRPVRGPLLVGLLVGASLQSVLWVQGFMPKANHHWTQRDLVAHYHRARSSSLEPLVAFQMDWKGETFYAQNRDLQVKKDAAELKRIIDRPGREFIIVHTDRLSALRTALGKTHEAQLQVLEKGHAKWNLVVVGEGPSP